jgi:hypothetical protein
MLHQRCADLKVYDAPLRCIGLDLVPSGLGQQLALVFQQCPPAFCVEQLVDHVNRVHDDLRRNRVRPKHSLVGTDHAVHIRIDVLVNEALIAKGVDVADVIGAAIGLQVLQGKQRGDGVIKGHGQDVAGGVQRDRRRPVGDAIARWQLVRGHSPVLEVLAQLGCGHILGCDARDTVGARAVCGDAEVGRVGGFTHGLLCSCQQRHPADTAET